MIRYLVLLVLASTLFFGMNMQPVEAHAFAQRYDLPIPLWLYLLAAGLTVFVSFFVIVIFLTKHEKKHLRQLKHTKKHLQTSQNRIS